MNVEHLITMANDIANFFQSEPDRAVAIDGVTNHLRKFWEPRMRRKIVAHIREQGEDGLSELAYAAVQRLAELDAAPTR
jgi:formate dehydrogenase subunit delta